MGKVLIIGAGGVSSVVVHKCAQHPEVFEEIIDYFETQLNQLGVKILLNRSFNTEILWMMYNLMKKLCDKRL